MQRTVRAQWHLFGLLALAFVTTRCAAPFSVVRPGYQAQTAMMMSTGPLTVQNQDGYLSYHSATYKSLTGHRVVRRAKGEACQRGMAFPLGAFGNKQTYGLTADVRWGDGALNKAMSAATSHLGPDEILVDVTIDMQRLSILSFLYRQMCLRVEGAVVAPVVPNI